MSKGRFILNNHSRELTNNYFCNFKVQIITPETNSYKLTAALPKSLIFKLFQLKIISRCFRGLSK